MPSHVGLIYNPQQIALILPLLDAKLFWSDTRDNNRAEQLQSGKCCHDTKSCCFPSFFTAIESDWREGWWIATLLVRRSGNDHDEHLPSINTEFAVTARTNASQRTRCSVDGTAVRLWQAVSHSMSSHGRLSQKFIYSAWLTETERKPL